MTEKLRFPGGIAILLFCLALLAPAVSNSADIAPLLSRADSAAKRGDTAIAVDALEQALERLRAEAPLKLKPFMVVSRPAKYFGDHEARANSVYARGEVLNFYLEPKNLVTSRGDSGAHEPAFEVDLEVVDAKGRSIARKDRFGSFRLPSRSPLQDIYMNLKVTLTGMPEGEYGVRFAVRDLNSKKSGTVEQRITLK